MIPWNYNKSHKICLVCKTDFLVSPSRQVAKFCSIKCKGISQENQPINEKQKAGLKLGWGWNKGTHIQTNNALDLWRIETGGVGDAVHNWKGDNVKYGALHHWVTRWLGKPSICEHCGKGGLYGMKVHWANKSHKYLRDLNDWIRLCVPCHSKYDNASKI